jgi:hypothetical protein
MSKSTIRLLTPEELALISGGAQVDTNDLPPVEVRPPDDWGPNPGPPDIIDPILDPGPGDNGGGGGGESTYEQVDGAADTVARSVEAMIRADPAYQSREIGAVIYRDPATGEIKATALTYGAVNTPDQLSLPLGDAGITASDVVGIIHSHPANALEGATHEVNKYPSDNRAVNGQNYNGGDWAAADLLRDNGMNPDTFRHYIIGPDGVTREYNFNDRDAETLGSNL